jgi:hypothetical protein
MKAALGEDARGRVDDLRSATALAGIAPGRWQGDDIHADHSRGRLVGQDGRLSHAYASKAIVFCHGAVLNSIYWTIEFSGTPA